MKPLNRWQHFRSFAWWHQAQQRSPRLFTAGVLMAAVALAIAHYTFGDWVIYPKATLWKERAFWAAFPAVACLPLLHWVAWTMVSLGRIKPAPVILAATAALCLGDLAWHLVWLNIEAVDLEYKPILDYWDWWGYWMPGVLLAGNLFLARRWWQAFRPAKSREARTYTRPELILRGAAVFLGWCAAVLTAIHLVTPRMTVDDFALSIADAFLVQEEWKKDFDFVVRHFYPDLDEPVYQQFVLSPVVDRLPLSELDWRRTLWENFYPRVRNEHDPAQAAQTVVRFLRERVGIDPAYRYRVGVETIWTQQMTDETGFERIYVAVLRSVGIAARLNEGQRAELWAGNTWHEAPRPVVASWSANIETRN